MRQARNRKAWAIKECFIWPEVHAGAGIAFTAGANNLQILHLFAIFKGDVIDLTIAAHINFYALRQGVNHRDPHAVQTARELVIFVREFTACVQTAKNQFYRRNTFFRVNIHRHPTAIVNHFQRLVSM